MVVSPCLITFASKGVHVDEKRWPFPPTIPLITLMPTAPCGWVNPQPLALQKQSWRTLRGQKNHAKGGIDGWRIVTHGVHKQESCIQI